MNGYALCVYCRKYEYAIDQSGNGDKSTCSIYLCMATLVIKMRKLRVLNF